MLEPTIYDVDDEVVVDPKYQALAGAELWRFSQQLPLRITRIDDLSGLDCDCRRRRGRTHRAWCASTAVERNGGHPQLLFFSINGQTHRLSAAYVQRPPAIG